MSESTFEALMVAAIALPLIAYVALEIWVRVREARRASRIWRTTAYSLHRDHLKTHPIWDWPARRGR